MAALSVYLAALAVGLTVAYFKFLYRRRYVEIFYNLKYMTTVE